VEGKSVHIKEESALSSHILVTGGAGYIGSVMVPVLLNAGHRVTVLDNFMYHQDSLAHVCHETRFNVVVGDVRSKQTVKKLLRKADIIIPLAALVGAPLCEREPVTAVQVNQDAIRQMVQSLSKHQRVLIPTTNSGYGVGQKGKFCTEESPMRPLSLYARTKIAAEKAVLAHGNSLSFRLATVFGVSPRARIDLLVNHFTYRAVKDRYLVLFQGHFKRNFIHVRDVARVFCHGMDHFSEMKGEIFNAGLSDANLSKVELCRRIRKHIPGFFYKEAKIGKDPDQRNYIVSNAKLEKTGFSPQYSIDHGIRELIKSFAMMRTNTHSNV